MNPSVYPLVSFPRVGSVCTGPLKALWNSKSVSMGIRITPLHLSDFIGHWIQEVKELQV
jgi:hypothetical protein